MVMVRYGNNWEIREGRMGHGYALLCMTFFVFCFYYYYYLIITAISQRQLQGSGFRKRCIFKKGKDRDFFEGRMGEGGLAG